MSFQKTEGCSLPLTKRGRFFSGPSQIFQKKTQQASILSGFFLYMWGFTAGNIALMAHYVPLSVMSLSSVLSFMGVSVNLSTHASMLP